MTGDRTFARYLARFPYLAAGGYVTLVLVLIVAVWASLANVYRRHLALENTTALLNQLKAREHSAHVPSMSGPAPAGSPFLQGSTVTIAGAALLQKVAGAITRQGGNVLSSQVDLHGTDSKAGFVRLVVSCELAQKNLQSLLYNLEAGMPFLFVDQLVVSAEGVRSEAGRMQVLLVVSGQWQGGR
jgi:general secretion pathway protein M